MRRRITSLCVAVALLGLCASPAAAAAGVTFERGYAAVDGRPFFPIGVYTYRLDRATLDELKGMGFNTVVAGFEPDQLPLIHEARMKAICVDGPEWRAAAPNHPALLGWYLMDEPEGGKTVPEVLAAYRRLKRADPSHPVGLVHSMFEAISIFRDCADFTMPDVYPVTAERDAPLASVARYVDEARRVHGEGWPCWPFIQAFGGPDTDGGKWALPTPREVRCMTFLAVAHGATGVLYFSHWPQGGETWRSLAGLNRDLTRVVPWLVAADGEEVGAASSRAEVHLRVRRVGGDYLVIAVNDSREAVRAGLRVDGLGATALHGGDAGSRVTPVAGAWEEAFEPLGVKLFYSKRPDAADTAEAEAEGSARRERH
jgi:hypothetical protein